MGSYLDRQYNPDGAITARTSRQEMDPDEAAEIAAERAAKQERVNAELAIAARRLAGDKTVLAEDAARAEAREREYEERAALEPSNDPEYNS